MVRAKLNAQSAPHPLDTAEMRGSVGVMNKLFLASFLLFASGLIAAPETPQTSPKKEDAQTTSAREPFGPAIGQIHSITYTHGEEKITRYFKIVEGKFKRFHLIEVKDLGGEEIPMPVLRKVSPNAIANDDDDNNLKFSSDDDPETWVLRSAGFFFASATAKRDAPTRPQLITAANGLTYRYYGAAPYMKDVMANPGPDGERAIEAKVYEERDGKQVLVHTMKPASPKSGDKDEEKK